MPSIFCCSTEAGSVSPWVTMMRRRRGTVFAGHFLPGGLALVHSEIDLALRIARLEKDSPAIFGHLHVVELGPAIGFDADGGAQIDLEACGFRWGPCRTTN